MPFTPYHFGPSGFVGLVFKKYLDLPVFVLANVIVDIEVLFYDHWPVHRYAHTLLLGAAVGILWALAAFPCRSVFAKIMKLLRLPYQTGLKKMIISGILGVWFHVLIDSIYHWDVRLFWPSSIKPLFALLSTGQVKISCIILWLAALVLYAIYTKWFIKNKTSNKKNESIGE